MQLPSSCPENSHVGFLIHLLHQGSASRIPFGLYLHDPDNETDKQFYRGGKNTYYGYRSTRRIDDDAVLTQENTLHAWLDYLLDDMKGRSAALLRRDRFQHWCPEYEYRLGLNIYRRVRPRQRENNPVMIMGGSLFRSGLVFEMNMKFIDRFAALKLHAEEMLPSEHNTEWETRFPDGIPRKSENELWPHDLDEELFGLSETWNFGIPQNRDMDTACQVLGGPYSPLPYNRCGGRDIWRLKAYKRMRKDFTAHLWSTLPTRHMIFRQVHNGDDSETEEES